VPNLDEVFVRVTYGRGSVLICWHCYYMLILLILWMTTGLRLNVMTRIRRRGKGVYSKSLKKGIERPLKAVGVDFGFHTAVNTLKLTDQGIAPDWAGI